MRGSRVDAQCAASRVRALTVCSQDVTCRRGKAPPYTTVAGIVSEGRHEPEAEGSNAASTLMPETSMYLNCEIADARRAERDII
jgi:hypothetical protein